MRSATVALLLLCWCATLAAAGPAIPRTDLFKIEVTGCKTEPSYRILTGFRMAGQKGIVTALHGVVGYGGLSASSDAGGHYYKNLRIGQVDIDRDVVLLVSDSLLAQGVAGLEAVSDTLEFAHDLEVLGYPLNSRRVNPTKVTLRSQAISSFNSFTPDLRMYLQQRGSPMPWVEVLNVQGHILPCDSGAPLVDSENRVVGIAIGGLESGTVEYSYAVPIWQVGLVPVGPDERSRLNQLADEELGGVLHASSGKSMADWTQARDMGRNNSLWLWIRGGASLVSSSVGESGWFVGTEALNPIGGGILRRLSFVLEYHSLDYTHETEYQTFEGLPPETITVEEAVDIWELGLRIYPVRSSLFWLYAGVLGGAAVQQGFDYTGALFSLDLGLVVNPVGRLQFGAGYRYSWGNQQVPELVVFDPFGDADVQSQVTGTDFGRFDIEIGWLLFR